MPVALCIVLWLPAACGGGGSSDWTATFQNGFSSVGNMFRSTSQAIGTAIQQAPSRTDAQLAAEFHDLAQRWQSDLNRLEPLKPPSSVASAFNKMTAAATQAETDLNAIAGAAGRHDASAARQAASSLVTDVLAAKSASTTIAKQTRDQVADHAVAGGPPGTPRLQE
jgi:hypothetical protein